MSQEMMDKTCRDFAEALAAREPVPGGGSASAFVGALGASLCGMVARYGATNPALADRADDLTRAFAQADELAQELVELVAEDVSAYGQVSAAYGISRDDPARAAAIQDALHVAAMPPYRIMDACGRALALLEDMADKGSRQLLSDVACGAVFCRAAMQGASLTLFANTTSMKDRARAEELETACDELLDTWLPRADALARLWHLTPEQCERFNVALNRWLKSAVRAELLSWPCVRAEVPFFSLGCEDEDIARYGAYAEGAIDALATDPADPSRALVIDYKTGGTPDETPDQLLEKHALQARVYADVLHKAGFENVTVKFVRVEQTDPAISVEPAEPQVVTYNL